MMTSESLMRPSSTENKKAEARISRTPADRKVFKIQFICKIDAWIL